MFRGFFVSKEEINRCLVLAFARYLYENAFAFPTFFASSFYRLRQDQDFCHAVRNLCFLGLERSLSIIRRADLCRISREDFFFANAPPRTRRSSVITQGPKGNSRTSRNVWPVPEAGSDSSSKFYRIIALINEHGQGSEIEAHTMYFLLPFSFVFTCNFRVLRQASI